MVATLSNFLVEEWDTKRGTIDKTLFLKSEGQNLISFLVKLWAGYNVKPEKPEVHQLRLRKPISSKMRKPSLVDDDCHHYRSMIGSLNVCDLLLGLHYVLQFALPEELACCSRVRDAQLFVLGLQSKNSLVKAFLKT
ncbi:hypothetical protein Tco_1042385 [Tanacetum coccineum]|uniref:Uncharacterized protein n=1 Tax=Tanacetum coccineum TaxID=301880 RepID=A0ABQ5GK59_9ASTR